MAEFKRKSLPAELNEAIRSHASALPSVTPNPAPAPAPQPTGGGEGSRRAPPTCQVNFNVTLELADIIAAEAAKAGSTRRFIAKLMKDAGFDVPEADVSPHDNRRRRRGG